MAKYLLQQFTPNQLNIDFKLNNLKLNLPDLILSGAVSDILAEELPLQHKHLLTTKDYLLLQNRLFLLIKYLTLLITYNKGYFDTFWQNIDENIRKLISKVFIRVITYNGKSISGNVIESVKINNKTKKYQNYNKGVINLGDNYIPSAAYVNTYNNLDKDVYGISGIILNDNVYWPDINGNVEITGLIPKNQKIVNTFNNKSGVITNVISAVTSSNITKYITYNKNNKGIINVNDIITTYIDTSLYAPRVDAYLTNCSADIYDPEQTYNPKRVATKKDVDNNILSSIGTNFIKIQDDMWQKDEIRNIYKNIVYINEGFNIINIYENNLTDLDQINLNTIKKNNLYSSNSTDDIVSCEIVYKTKDNKQYIDYVILSSLTPFNGFIGAFQNVYPEIIDDTRGIYSIINNISKKYYLTIPPSTANHKYLRFTVENLSVNTLEVENNFINIAYQNRNPINILYLNPKYDQTFLKLTAYDKIYQIIGFNNKIKYFECWHCYLKNFILPVHNNLISMLDGNGRDVEQLPRKPFVISFVENLLVTNYWFSVLHLTPLPTATSVAEKTITALIQKTTNQYIPYTDTTGLTQIGMSAVTIFSCIPYGNDLSLWLENRFLRNYITALFIDNNFLYLNPTGVITGKTINNVSYYNVAENHTDYIKYDPNTYTLSCKALTNVVGSDLYVDTLIYNGGIQRQTYNELYCNKMSCNYDILYVKNGVIFNYVFYNELIFYNYDPINNYNTLIDNGYIYFDANKKWIYSLNRELSSSLTQSYTSRNGGAKTIYPFINYNVKSGCIEIPSGITLSGNDGQYKDFPLIFNPCNFNLICNMNENDNIPISVFFNCKLSHIYPVGGIQDNITYNNNTILYIYINNNFMIPQNYGFIILNDNKKSSGQKIPLINMWFQNSNNNYYIAGSEVNEISWLRSSMDDNIGFIKTSEDPNRYEGILIATNENNTITSLLSITDKTLLYDIKDNTWDYETSKRERLSNIYEDYNISMIRPGCFSYLTGGTFLFPYSKTIIFLNYCFCLTNFNNLIIKSNKTIMKDSMFFRCNNGINNVYISSNLLDLESNWYGGNTVKNIYILNKISCYLTDGRISSYNFPIGNVTNIIKNISSNNKITYLTKGGSNIYAYENFDNLI